MKTKFFLLFLFFLPSFVIAQQADSGKIELKADPRVDKLIQRRAEFFQIDSTESGFRIQIYSTTDRKQVKLEEEKFKLNYPDLPIYLKYDSPNFKLRIGDFSTKLEAQHWFHNLEADYPTLFLVPDKVNP